MNNSIIEDCSPPPTPDPPSPPPPPKSRKFRGPKPKFGSAAWCRRYGPINANDIDPIEG